MLDGEAGPTTSPSTLTPDYSEHLEIDFDDKDETPPPWEEGEAAAGGGAAPPGPPTREDLDWVPDAVRDVAYYLRQYKFNEYDRRYAAETSTGSVRTATATPEVTFRRDVFRTDTQKKQNTDFGATQPRNQG